MPPTWKKGAKPELLASLIESIVERKPGGDISYNDWKIYEYLQVLLDQLRAASGVPEFEKKRILSNAVREAARQGPVTANAILAAFADLQAAYFQKPTQRFVLVTSISVTPHVKFRRLRIENVSIRFSATLPPQFRKARVKASKEARSSLFADPPHDQLTILASVRARSSVEAGETALEAINLVRSIWNLAINSRWVWTSRPGRSRPLNELLLGPVHSLHRPNGAGVEPWWYDPAYCERPPLWHHPEHVERLERSLHQVRARLACLSHADRVRRWLLRYGKALDERHWENAMLQLWSLLEVMTLVEKGYRHDSVAKRVAFVCGHNNHDYTNLLLHHLADQRHKHVHQADASEHQSGMLYPLKSFAEEMLLFHLRIGRHFHDTKELVEFLSLFEARPETARLMKQLKLAERFQLGSTTRRSSS